MSTVIHANSMGGVGEGGVRALLVALATVQGVAAVALVVAPEPVLAMLGASPGVPVALGWVSAQLALAAVLAALGARDPQRETRLMVLLAAGGAWATVALGRILFLADSPAGAGRALAAALVLTLLALAALALQWSGTQPGVGTAAVDRETVRALMESLLPATEPGATLPAPTDARLLAALDERIADGGQASPLRRRLALRALDVAAWRVDRRRFAALDADARASLLDTLEASAGFATRAAGDLVRSVRRELPFVFWGDERVVAAIGWDARHVRTRALLGPNADSWREREERAAGAADEAGGRQSVLEAASTTAAESSGTPARGNESPAPLSERPSAPERADGDPARTVKQAREAVAVPASEARWSIGNAEEDAASPTPRWARDAGSPTPPRSADGAPPLRVVRAVRLPGRS